MYFQNSVSLRNKDIYIYTIFFQIDGKKNVIFKFNSILKSHNLFLDLISCILIEFRTLLCHIDFNLLYIYIYFQST